MLRASPRTDDAAGFTLIEVLVALVILGLAFGFAFRAFSQSFFAQERARQDATATVFASAILARVGNDIPLHPGHLAGRTIDGYSWRIDIAPYGPAPVPRAGSRAGWRCGCAGAIATPCTRCG